MRVKILVPLLSLVTALMLSNCVSAGMIVGMAKDYPVSQWIQIHKNPKVGDKITLVSKAGKSTMRIDSVENGVAEVVQTVGDYGVEYHFFADRNGNVKKASIWNLESGEKFDLKLASSEKDIGYVISKKKIKLANPVTVKTAVGEFKVTEALAVNMAGTVKQFVYLLNSDVKFGYVKAAAYKVTHDDTKIKAMDANAKAFGLSDAFNAFEIAAN